MIIFYRANVKNSQFDFKILLPKLSFDGDYNMNMRILLLRLQGKGIITGNLSEFLSFYIIIIVSMMMIMKINFFFIANYKAEVNMKGDKVEKNGKKYLQMRKMKTKLDVGDVSIHMTNLFNGDPVLGELKLLLLFISLSLSLLFFRSFKFMFFFVQVLQQIE